MYGAMPEGPLIAGFPRIASLPLRGRYPLWADRAPAAGKTDEESGEVAAHGGKREPLAANDKDFSLTLEMTIRESH